ncbi:MAG: hypothetical protein QF662_05850 [Phycisphaerae bacterium]|jgi:hypothetical protein|nr:hypothetical protein [Phycisphaerae bacterium]
MKPGTKHILFVVILIATFVAMVWFVLAKVGQVRREAADNTRENIAAPSPPSAER